MRSVQAVFLSISISSHPRTLPLSVFSILVHDVFPSSEGDSYSPLPSQGSRNVWRTKHRATPWVLQSLIPSSPLRAVFSKLIAKPLLPEGKQSEFLSMAEVGQWTNVSWCNGSQVSDMSKNNVFCCFGKLL